MVTDPTYTLIVLSTGLVISLLASAAAIAAITSITAGCTAPALGSAIYVGTCAAAAAILTGITSGIGAITIITVVA